MSIDVMDKDIALADPCRMKDVYRYMMAHSPDARTYERQIRGRWAKLRSVWPPDELPLLERYERAYMRLERYELRHAFAQGMMSAYRMCLGLPYVQGDAPEETLLHEEELEKRYDYRSLDRKVGECMKPLGTVMDRNERCMRLLLDWHDDRIQFGIIRLNFSFLSGTHYGLFLCKLVDPLFRENDRHMAALYAHVHMTGHQ